MGPYVVPLGAEETGRLTLAELDGLLGCKLVLFERADHPLAARLDLAGIDTGVLRDEPLEDLPPEDRDGLGIVTDPGSTRLVSLARAGADVSSGVVASADALSAAHAAPRLRANAEALGRLDLVMARLHSEDGCPWDIEQTHESLTVHLLEEAYEVVDEIERGEHGDALEEELGDVLLQVAFHARLAARDGRFDLAGVANHIAAKLIHRHPHVFGEVSVTGAEEVLANWEKIKTVEKNRSDPFEGIPAALPALVAAVKVQKRAVGLGFTASEPAARERLAAFGEGDGKEDLGEVLFWTVAIARARGVDPEGALRHATARFRNQWTERRAGQNNA